MIVAGALLCRDLFGDDRLNFGNLEKLLRGKRIRVTARSEITAGKPEIILNDPSQVAQ